MLKILVVDDNADDCMMFLRYLEDYEVTTVPTLSEALNVLKTKKIDIVVLDYCLPDGDGVDFIKAMRLNDILTPVVFVTGCGSERVAVQALKIGASDYLSKDCLGKDMLIASIAEVESRELNVSQSVQAIGLKAREMAKKYL